ncbi:MAG: SDR family oxidoreductase, partial [Burkholderiaceae bacterium]
MAFLQGKKILITGLLSNRSIAYGIAQACKREGAELAFTYVGERFKDRITDFAKEFDSKLVFDCDVGSDEQINARFADLAKSWSQLDGLVHAIGFAPREAIAGDFLDGMTRENFRIAHDISAYSFPALAKASLEASVRYLAESLGKKGVRVNGISAGPIKTLAASGIKDFGKIL